ncbi:MAG: uracil-DNA glycosylase family protein [Proteobacteria bacterium]|nr:uracil-DNA glycosylase family protein [Pseudomonadota bacterium]
MSKLKDLITIIEACRLCADQLPLGPRPVLRVSKTAKLMIIGQAPGTKVHESGVPWEDASGDRLRDWLGLTPDIFDDQTLVAIMPMGFCYPGRAANGGDNPPRPECAPEWHPKLLPLVSEVKLTLLVGGFAQKYYLGKAAQKTMTETVRAWQEHLPRFLPIPHPSWRSTGWLRKNSWFEAEVIPDLRRRVRRLID